MRAPQRSIRHKLLAMVLLPLVGVLPVLGAILLWWGDIAIDQVLITKVRSDLAVARSYFDSVRGEVGTGVATVAESSGLRKALDAGNPAAVERLLRDYRERSGFTFVNWRAPDGRLLVSDWGQPDSKREYAGWPAGTEREATGGIGLRGHDALAAVLVMEGRTFAALAPSFQAQVPVPVMQTQGAREPGRSLEERALVMVATAPVLDDQGRMQGHVQAGVLLNRNLDFIDRINEIVYPQGALPFGSRGTATMFLDDVRISTNVRLFGPENAGRMGATGGSLAGSGSVDADAGQARAIGTRVSAAVHQAVLDEGRTWLDRAFVVNEWYVSAYEPLTDPAGRRVGMLYVGFLEQPFTQLKHLVLLAIGAVFFAVMIGAAWLSLRTARSIFRPVERMEATMRRIEGGDAQARVGATDSEDELGQLARDLDHLLEAQAQNTRTLQEWNAVLDARVAERTADLEEAQRRLVQSEKLAVIGQLSAGMAHEINNPIAVIQGNVDLMRHALGTAAQSVGPEFKLIDQQIDRMRLIVTQMLQFARPGEYSGDSEVADVARVLEGSQVLTQHAVRPFGVEVHVKCDAGLQAAIPSQALQQVLVNLIMNAMHAMPQGGKVQISARPQSWSGDHAGVCIAVSDEGPGLPASVRDGLFQPFVTHKKDGTGLGLWISRSIVERHGGELRASNRPADEGSGAVFTVLLRAEPGATRAGRNPASPPG